MHRAKKVTELAALKTALGEAELLIISQNKGMTVAQVTELRRNLAKTGAKYKVTKNTLTKLASQGTKFEQAADMMTGPTGFTMAKDDPYATIKAIYEFAKKNETKISLIGAIFGDVKMDAKAVEQMAKLPSLNEIRGKLVGLIQAPAAQLARLAQAYATKETQA